MQNDYQSAGSDMQFASGGGEMGELTRLKNWEETSLGNPQFWPASLKITLSILLKSSFPMFLWWGPELICFYNDAYRPSLGKEGKHPSILGMPAKDAWAEIWDIIKPLIDKVLHEGESIWFEDMLLPIYRNGHMEDVYWTFSYSPVTDDTGNIEGVLVTCTETTEKISIKKQLEESERKLKLIISQAPVSIGIFRGPQYTTEIANSKALQLWGRRKEDILNKPILDAMPELRAQGIQKLLDDVYQTGNTFSATALAVQMLRKGNIETAFVNFSYDALYNEQGEIDGIMAVGIEVTDQVLSRKIIEANEEKLNIVIQASELGTWELDMNTNEVLYSNRYLKIFGYSENDTPTHLQLLQHLHPDDLPIRDKAFKDALQTGYLHYKSRIIWNDGSLHWFEGRGKLFYDKEHKPIRLIGTIRDITEEKTHSKKIEESEQQLRDLIMHSPVPKAILRGKEHIVEMANEVLLQNIWRREEKDVIGKSILDVFPELRQQKYAQILDHVYATGKKWQETESLISLSGADGLKTFYVDCEYAPLIESDNNISGIKITAVDVTEKVEARLKIEKSEQKFRLLADSMPQYIWTADTDGNIDYYNQSVYNFTGLTVEDIHGDGWLKMIHPDDRDANAREWMKAVTSGESFLYEHRFRKHTGEYRWQLSRALPQKDEEGNIQMWVGTSTDIQEQKTFAEELEKQVIERTKELGQKNSELEKMNKELQSFAYISSHDLQEPLRKIQTFSSFILKKEFKNLSDIGKDHFTRMQLAAGRMQLLIDDLLAYSRTNITERQLEKAELSDIIALVKEDLKEEIATKHASIELNQGCEMHIIPFQFRQLLQNLISNALKFSKPGCAPVISIICNVETGEKLNNPNLQAGKKYCHIAVSDNGIGFEQEYNERIFELFQRLHSKSDFHGTGIGLAIVKKIVENHNGIITAAGVPGEGATFEMYLPVV